MNSTNTTNNETGRNPEINYGYDAREHQEYIMDDPVVLRAPQKQSVFSSTDFDFRSPLIAFASSILIILVQFLPYARVETSILGTYSSETVKLFGTFIGIELLIAAILGAFFIWSDNPSGCTMVAVNYVFMIFDIIIRAKNVSKVAKITAGFADTSVKLLSGYYLMLLLLIVGVYSMLMCRD